MKTKLKAWQLGFTSLASIVYKNMTYYKILFGSLEGRGGEERVLEGENYTEKWRNFSHFLKEHFFR